MHELRDIWEETSFVLERRQANPHCVQEEQTGLRHRMSPPYAITFNPDEVSTIQRPVGKLLF